MGETGATGETGDTLALGGEPVGRLSVEEELGHVWRQLGALHAAVERLVATQGLLADVAERAGPGAPAAAGGAAGGVQPTEAEAAPGGVPTPGEVRAQLRALGERLRPVRQEALDFGARRAPAVDVGNTYAAAARPRPAEGHGAAPSA